MSDVAIIGIAGRFPGARDPEEFWRNLQNGVESISRLADDELEVRNAAELARLPNYVRARGVIEGADQFDPEFFGMYPKEAAITDPQHRIFLECCWEALENAGYDPLAYPAPVGVFAGCSVNTYFLEQLCTSREFLRDYTGAYQVGNYTILTGSNSDFLATRVAYKLNLKGPAYTLHCGCSTSLVAVSQACQSLLSYQCDAALAGGVSITFPQKRGYLYDPGGMASPDGHCRTFDENAQGTVFGSGAAVVVLKRLEEAQADGDYIYAVIRGCAVNNDGSGKVGFAAPGVEGQARVISMAQAVAGVAPETISYIEAHGTGTPLGDPIEVAALSKVFRRATSARHYCSLGTAKTNVGHLDVAAGATGLIKTALMLRDRKVPPLLNFERPNPHLELAGTPFYVNTELTEWKRGETPRRAGVSAFGVGGTNAHVVLEEAPERPPATVHHPSHLLLLSARSENALNKTTSSLAAHLKQKHSELADVAYTLQAGRHPFEHRRMLVADNIEDAAIALETLDTRRVITGRASAQPGALTFLFPGQGTQHVNMGRELYRSEPVFHDNVDRCAAILAPQIGLNLTEILYPSEGDTAAATHQLNATALAQPAIFIIEYALAQLWMSWNVRPEAMIGHSIGEYVAACLAGVFSLEDALTLIATRGRLMQSLPRGAMLSVRVPAEQLRPRLNGLLSLAAVNGPSLCVVSGPIPAVGALNDALQGEGVVCRPLHTSHAFHSAMMDPILEPFAQAVARVRREMPRIPYISSITGDWITPQQAAHPAYWAQHLRQPVQFSAGILKLAGQSDGRVLLETGPGITLATLARQHLGKAAIHVVISSLPEPGSSASDIAAIQNAQGRLWLSGVAPDWQTVHSRESCRRVPLPTYPFERKRCWVDGVEPALSALPTTTNIETPKEEIRERPVTKAIMETPTFRLDRLRAALSSMVEDLSGVEMNEAGAAASFLELGFDSLFLTQVAQAVQAKFGLKIQFRQLMDQECSVDALAAYLDKNLTAEAFPAPAAPVSSAPAPVTTAPATPAPAVALPASVPIALNGTGGNALERIVSNQLQAMQQLMVQQLDMLRGTAFAVAPAAASEPALPNVVPVPEPVSLAVPAQANKAEFKPFGPYKPIQKGPTGDLTPQQQACLNGLIERYTRRTPESKRLTQQYRAVLADPRVAAGFRSQWKEIVYPIVTVRSRGSKLWDVDGNEYIDILNGFGPTAFGHLPEFVVEAVNKQLHEGMEIGPQTRLAGQAAELLCELTGHQRATFCNTGSEAVMAALRVARTVTGRSRVVMFAGAYHGMFDEVLVKGIKRGDAHRSLPIAPGIPQAKAENITVLDYATPESLAYIEAHAQELAAVLVEPVQSRHPNLQPREFLQHLRDITTASGTALIIDEVVTGFRVHPGGVQALFNIKADLATYGKVLGGGMPIGALAGKAAFMDALDGGMWRYGDNSYPEAGVTFFAGTFVRHPLAMAAAMAILNHVKSSGPQLQEGLTQKTARMVGRLNEFLRDREAPIQIETFGSIFYFSFPSEVRFGSLFYYHLREKGVHIQEGFPCFLTTAHSEADVEHIIRAFQESVVEMQQGGLLAAPKGEIMLPGLPPEGPREAPLTESQMEIWLSAQLGPEASASYNESFSLTFNGPLNVGALRNALAVVILRHEALRAYFSPDGEMQYFASSLDLDLPVTDLSALPAETRKAKLREMISADARLPFDLIHGPLVRVSLIRLMGNQHVLRFTTHHIVCDGWSTNVLLDELAKLYNAACGGGRPELPAPMKFGDYARAQQRHFLSEEGTEIESYWTRQFADVPLLLDLPTDRPRPAMKSYHGATYRRKIGAAAYQNIKRAGARQKCTLFVTLLAGFEALLARLSGQEDIVVGIPAAGQSLVEEAVLVGHCVNFVPLRGRLTGDPDGAQFLEQMRRTLLDAYDHQNYTYGRLVRKLSIPRDPSRLPLIEVQFNLERVGAGLEFSGLQIEIDANPKSFVNFDLFLNVVEGDNGLTLDLDYNTDLFDEATVARWLASYETLLEGLAADPTQRVSHLPLLGEAERRQVLVEWNRTQADYPRDMCVHRLFEEQAARTPAAIAAIYDDQQLTYEELNRKADHLAGYLAELGVRPGMLVGVFVERSLEMIIGLLGVLKAGGAYVPIDPTYPAERIAFVLEDANVSILLTQEKLAKDLSPARVRVVCLDTQWEAIVESGAAPLATVTSEDLAYVIYTSGSTGTPKGVEILHRAVVNLLCSMRQEPGLEAHDTLLAVTTLSFDIAGLELFLPLSVGAKLVIASRETASDGTQLLARLVLSGATIIQATPVSFRLLIEAGWNGDPRLKILCGGEALSRELANQLLQRTSSLWNMYGPTETTIWSSTIQIQSGEGPVPIGLPIHNTQFHVLDARGELVPIGVAGELHIGGDGLARGYFRRPELTAEKFIPDPFHHDSRARLYKTGDQVRRLTDGSIEFLSRLDSQVKLRGFRIELGEIESALARYPGVRQAVVILREDVPGDKRLVAYVTADHAAVTVTLVREFLTGKLPDYMLPSAVVRMDSLPLTPNGKIDRRALPAAETGQNTNDKEFVAPRTAQEKTLADIWAEVLKVDRVGITDNLFELGADSLHVFQITARAKKAGLSVTPKQLLQRRTISAVMLEDAAEPAVKQPHAAIVPVSRNRFRIRRGGA